MMESATFSAEGHGGRYLGQKIDDHTVVMDNSLDLLLDLGCLVDAIHENCSQEAADAKLKLILRDLRQSPQSKSVIVCEIKLRLVQSRNPRVSAILLEMMERIASDFERPDAYFAWAKRRVYSDQKLGQAQPSRCQEAQQAPPSGSRFQCFDSQQKPKWNKISSVERKDSAYSHVKRSISESESFFKRTPDAGEVGVVRSSYVKPFTAIRDDVSSSPANDVKPSPAHRSTSCPASCISYQRETLLEIRRQLPSDELPDDWSMLRVLYPDLCRADNVFHSRTWL